MATRGSYVLSKLHSRTILGEEKSSNPKQWKSNASGKQPVLQDWFLPALNDDVKETLDHGNLKTSKVLAQRYLRAAVEADGAV